jgi:hypothetical protein
MIKADPEYYRNLEKTLAGQGRWCYGGVLGFWICILFALGLGATDGWPWLVGSFVFAMMALWFRLDQQNTCMKIEIYLANAQ